MAPDGKSLITAVGSEDRAVWLHDKNGERPLSSEGNTSLPRFSSDGNSLYFLKTDGQASGDELWIKDLRSGKAEKVVTNYPMVRYSAGRDVKQEYSISRDGKQVAFSVKEPSGRTNLWIAPTSRRSSPVRISSAAAEDIPFFLPSGDLIFRAIENGSSFVYRMKSDGSGRHKVFSERILDLVSVSPDGRWVIVGAPKADEAEMAQMKAFPVDGGASVPICAGYCYFIWDTEGKNAYVSFEPFNQTSYLLPVTRGVGLPKLPPGGLRREDFSNTKTNVVASPIVQSAVNASLYAYTRMVTRRNLYRIPIP